MLISNTEIYFLKEKYKREGMKEKDIKKRLDNFFKELKEQEQMNRFKKRARI